MSARAESQGRLASEWSMADPKQKSSSTGSQPDPLLGRVINDRFKILSMIARGGMGKVYRAEQAPLGRICAVKVLNPNYAGDNDPEFHKRFFLEAATSAKLSHPNTVKIFDYGRTDDDVYFMAMELLEGRTLHRLIRESAPLDPRRTVQIARQIARSLREAHGLGVIHRDLKPANVYLIQHDEEDDFVKVLDFGLVKNVEDESGDGGGLTQTGLFMGSPKYMAPEQIRGERVTVGTDIYALGVVMYEMLTGKVPFDRQGSSVNTLMAHVNDPVPPMRETAPTSVVPAPVEDLVYKCLAKRAEDRFASMDEFLTALKRAGALAFGDGAINPTGEFNTSGSLLASGELLRADGSIVPAVPEATMTGSRRREGLVVEPTNTPPGTVITPVREEKKSRTPLLLIGAGVAAIAIGAAVMLSRSKPTPPAPVATKQNTPEPSPSTTPSVQVSELKLSLKSSPSSAEVYEGDQLLGTTPLETTWTGAKADPNAHHRFTFKRPDHRDLVVELTPANAKIEYNAILESVANNNALAADAGVVEATPDSGTVQQASNTVRTTPTSRPVARPTARPVTRPQNPANPRLPDGFRGEDNW